MFTLPRLLVMPGWFCLLPHLGGRGSFPGPRTWLPCCATDSPPSQGAPSPLSFQWSLSVVWERRDKWSLSAGEKRLSSRKKESHEPEVRVFVYPCLRKKQDSFPWRQWLGCDGCDEVFLSTSWGASGIPGSFFKKLPPWIFLSSATNS